MRIIFIFLLIITSNHLNIFSQQEYKLVSSESSLIINGTSTLHDWSMKLNEMHCISVFEIDNSGVSNITSLNFECPVKKLKSESSIMDHKAYDALKENKYPNITFKCINLEGFKHDNRKFSGKISGELSIAGITKPVEIAFTGLLDPNNNIIVSGAYKMKMSDFNVPLPTFLFGMFKTGNDITLNYQFKFKK